MMNQVQYHASVASESVVEGIGGFSCVARAEALREVEFQPPNDTNVEESIARLAKNDPALTTLNLNNIVISTETFLELFDTLKKNTVLVELHAANTHCVDAAIKVRQLNLDSFVKIGRN